MDEKEAKDIVYGYCNISPITTTVGVCSSKILLYTDNTSSGDDIIFGSMNYPSAGKTYAPWFNGASYDELDIRSRGKNLNDVISDRMKRKNAE